MKEGYSYSPATIHKYMNKELGLYSIVRRKKSSYKKQNEKAHQLFENKLGGDFQAEKKNQKWCTDFTYLYLKNGEVRYNCTIIDLYDRSVVASITQREQSSELAIKTLQKALETQPRIRGEVILHSDRGSQYTSKAFVEYCKAKKIRQSMSKAGYPYDNAVMERYFNSLKNECTKLHEYENEEELYKAIEEYAYVFYNHVRPHSYNGYRTPHQARMR